MAETSGEPAPDDLLTIAEAARHLKIGVAVFRQWIADGDVVGVLLKKQTRYMRADLDEARERRKRKKQWVAPAKTSSKSRRAAKSTTTTGPSEVLDFAALRAKKKASSPPGKSRS